MKEGRGEKMLRRRKEFEEGLGRAEGEIGMVEMKEEEERKS